MAAGLEYRGKFVEMNDEDIKLRGPTGWIILPIERVTAVAPSDVPPPEADPTKDIDPEFYRERDPSKPQS
jgi:hypothetical protein